MVYFHCNTRKNSETFTSDSLVVAVTSMQGWREEMEDAYCVLLPKDSALDRHALAMRRWRDMHRDAVNTTGCFTEDMTGEVGFANPLCADGGVSDTASNASTAATFFSQGHGTVRIGTSVDVSSHHMKSLSPTISSSVAAGPQRSTTRMTVCGVFDGHGGASVAEAAAKDMPKWILAAPSFEGRLFERAVYEAFVINDAAMHERWLKNRSWYGPAGCTANVVMIIEEYSAEITARLERLKLARAAAEAAAAATAVEGGVDASLSVEANADVTNASFMSAAGMGGGSDGMRSRGVSFSQSPQQGPLFPNASMSSAGGYSFGISPPAPIYGGSATTSNQQQQQQQQPPFDTIRIICANAGDARAILVRANSLVVPLSHDHKPSNPSEKARIVAAKGFVTTMGGVDRVDGILAVSRGFGDYSFKANKTLPQGEQLVIPHPDVRSTHQRRDLKGRFAFPFLGFGESVVNSMYSEALLRRANAIGNGGGGSKRIGNTDHGAADSSRAGSLSPHTPSSNPTSGVAGVSGGGRRTAVDRELRSLQRCLQWMPNASSAAGGGGGGKLGSTPTVPSTPHSLSTPHSSALAAAVKGPAALTPIVGDGDSSSLLANNTSLLSGTFPYVDTLDADTLPSEDPVALAAIAAAKKAAAAAAMSSSYNPPAPADLAAATRSASCLAQLLLPIESPPPFYLCDPSAMNSALFVAQACDGIWDCLTNAELSSLVVGLLDEQILEALGDLHDYDWDAGSRRDRTAAEMEAARRGSPRSAKKLRKRCSAKQRRGTVPPSAAEPVAADATSAGGMPPKKASSFESLDGAEVGSGSGTDAYESEELDILDRLEELFTSDEEGAEGDTTKEGADTGAPFAAQSPPNTLTARQQRRTELFRNFSTRINPTKITEAVVHHCLEHSFLTGGRVPESPATPNPLHAPSLSSAAAVAPTSSPKAPPSNNGSCGDAKCCGGAAPLATVATTSAFDKPPLRGESEMWSPTLPHATNAADDSLSASPSADAAGTGTNAPSLATSDVPLTATAELGGDDGALSGSQREQKTPMLSASCRGVCRPPLEAEADKAQLAAANAATSHHQHHQHTPLPVPRRPVNALGTDNMTFMLIFFKDGVAARAMLLYQQAKALKRRLRRAGVGGAGDVRFVQISDEVAT